MLIIIEQPEMTSMPIKHVAHYAFLHFEHDVALGAYACLLQSSLVCASDQALPNPHLGILSKVHEATLNLADMKHVHVKSVWSCGDEQLIHEL